MENLLQGILTRASLRLQQLAVMFCVAANGTKKPYCHIVGAFCTFAACSFWGVQP